MAFRDVAPEEEVEGHWEVPIHFLRTFAFWELEEVRWIDQKNPDLLYHSLLSTNSKILQFFTGNSILSASKNIFKDENWWCEDFS